jgi:SAM-dependent methyltransferase
MDDAKRHSVPESLAAPKTATCSTIVRPSRCRIDPASNVVETARDRGVETLCEFFSADLAEELRTSGRRASVLHANNVLAHVPDVNGVVTGIGRVLADDGVAVIETPYVRDLIERLEFDTIYHEHLFYYSLSARQRLCDRNGVRIVDVERIPIHGSLRVRRACGDRARTRPRRRGPAGGGGAPRTRDARLLQRWRQGRSTQGQLLALLDSLKDQGDRIAAYGAAAMGTVLLNAFGIGTERIEFVADRSDHSRVGLMPGRPHPHRSGPRSSSKRCR